MNLASRCREAISHVAMLKKELALQQKRTAQALAAQREQTKRMADSLTNTFINSPDSKGGSPRRSFHKRNSHSSNPAADEDENVMRLVSSTPSPSRFAAQQRQRNENSDGRGDGKKLFSDEESAPTSSRAKEATNPTEETRDSPATTATTTTTSSPTSDLEEEEIAVKKIPMAPDDETPDDEKRADDIAQKLPVVYSTPKKSERLKSSPFDNGFETSMGDKSEFFPVSASPKVFNKTNSARGKKSYDEEFPSDTIDQPESDKSKRKMNLLNSIDAFEQSFSIDFTESFTPKEGSRSTPSPSSGFGQEPYNPFFATPEKSKPRFDSSPFVTSKENEDTKTSESSKIEFGTPPKTKKSVTSTPETDDPELRPRRPEKTTPSAARARYERALRPRVEMSTQGRQPTVNSADRNTNSSGNNSGALQRRMEHRKRLDKNLQSTSNDLAKVSPSVQSSSSPPKKQTRNDIVDIVDAFEQTENDNPKAGNDPKSSSKFSGPIKSLRRRSVSKPISYAEPPLNTKLRRGDTFFPKTRPDMTDAEDAQNQVPNVIQAPAAVVSP